MSPREGGSWSPGLEMRTHTQRVLLPCSLGWLRQGAFRWVGGGWPGSVGEARYLSSTFVGGWGGWMGRAVCFCSPGEAEPLTGVWF